MTNQQHPITPNPEQIYLWQNDWKLSSYEPGITETIYVATQAAQWGADCELDACCGWLAQEFPREQTVMRELRVARRPKPPSKKQRGLSALKATNLKKDDPLLYQEILNAIEGLPND